MVAAKKFLFDIDFGVKAKPKKVLDNTGPKRDPATIPRYTGIEMEAAKKENKMLGFSEGRSKGLDEARAEINNQIAELLGSFSQKIDDLALKQAKDLTEIKKDASAFALKISKKLSATLIERQPIVEVEAVISDCLSYLIDLKENKELIIRVSPDITSTLENNLKQCQSKLSPGIKISVIADASINKGDCQIEWLDGGTTRHYSDIEGLIDKAVERYVHSLDTPKDYSTNQISAEPDSSSDSKESETAISEAEKTETTGQEENVPHEEKKEGDGESIKEVGGSKSVRYED